MSSIKSSENWDYTLFTKHPQLFLPFLEDEKRYAVEEASQLHKLLGKQMVATRSRVLDFSCGIGRHAINLSRLGYQVVGYDPSNLYLEKAKEWAHRLFNDQVRIRFYQGKPFDCSKVLRSHG
jgi:SAM-dependent methyltransferase